MRCNVVRLFIVLVAVTSNCARASDFSVDELVRDLRNGGVEERWQAARLLGTLGSRARPAAIYLTMALWDENRTVRYYAARSLAAIGPAVGDIAGANLLEAAKRDSNRYVREAAGNALRAVDPMPLFLKVPWLYAQVEGEPKDWVKKFQDERYKTVNGLILQLGHKDVGERRDAVALLASRRSKAALAIATLARALRDEDETVRYIAVRTLQEIGPSAYPISKESLLHVAARDPAKRVRERAEQTLKSFLESPLVADMRNDVSPNSLPNVTRSELDHALPPSEDRLTMQVISPDLTIRREATWELARLRKTDALTQGYLSRALIDEDEIVRYNAATALARLGSQAQPFTALSLDIVPVGEVSQMVLRRALLAKLLTDKDFSAAVRGKVASAKTGTTPTTKEERADLPPLLKSRALNSWSIRLLNEEYEAQVHALSELAKLGVRSRDQLPRLFEFLKHPNPYLQTYSIETIGLIGFQKHSNYCYRLIELSENSPGKLVRNAALEALRLNLDEEEIAQLREPNPPGRPTPERKVRQVDILSDKNITGLLQMLKQETQRSTALAILTKRVPRDKLGALFVLSAMSKDRTMRDIGMTALWDFASQPGIAAPLAYAIQHNMGTAHQVEMIDQIDVGQAHAPYLISYVMRSNRPRIRQAGLRAWLRITRQGDWRKILTLPWQYHDDDHHRQAIAAVKSLPADDVAAQAFLAGGMTLRDDTALLKFVIKLGAALREREHSHDRLTELYRGEKSLTVRQAIVWQLAQEKPVAESVIPDLLTAVLSFEANRSIREQAVRALRDYGPMAEKALPFLLGMLKKEESLEFQMKIVEAMKAIGEGDADLVKIVVPLEESLRIQQAREMLGELILDQAKLNEETRRRQKGLLLRSLAN